MIAVKRLQSLFWLLLVAFGALSAYLISLRVSTERNAVNALRAEIARTRADIRYLETEFSARANMRQLEKWNAQDYRYSTPSADHYLEGERALAHLDGIERNGPDYVAPPVMVAMVENPSDTGSVDVSASSPSSPASSQIRSDTGVLRTESAKMAVADTVDTGKIGGPKSSAAKSQAGMGSSLARKAERMAMLDSRLLDDGAITDLGRRAMIEGRKGSR
jgi:hypothetical protein